MPLLATLMLAAVAPKIVPGKIVVGVHPIALAVAPTGTRFVACLEDGSVRIMDAKTRATIRTLDKHPGPAYAAAWSADGAFVAIGDETARIWIHNALTGAKVREYRTHTKGIEKLSFNLPGTLLISTGKDDQVNVYDLRTDDKKERMKVLGKGVNFYGATFHPKLPYTFAVGMLGGGARMYDALQGKLTGFLSDAGGQGIFDVAFNPAGTRAVGAGRDGTLLVLGPAQAAEARQVAGPRRLDRHHRRLARRNARRHRQQRPHRPRLEPQDDGPRRRASRPVHRRLARRLHRRRFDPHHRDQHGGPSVQLHHPRRRARSGEGRAHDEGSGEEDLREAQATRRLVRLAHPGILFRMRFFHLFGWAFGPNLRIGRLTKVLGKAAGVSLCLATLIDEHPLRFLLKR